jgi:hydroxyacylglutathione hydrolase
MVAKWHKNIIFYIVQTIVKGKIMVIKQIKVGKMSEFTYIVGCEETRISCVIDPGGKVKKICSIADSLGLKIRYVFNTHYHADHTCGNRELVKLTGAEVLIHKLDVRPLRQFINLVKIGCLDLTMSPYPGIVIDGEKHFDVGNIRFTLFHTPGHSEGGMCFLAGNCLFTGDTLFVGDSGRTDLPGGNRKKMGESLRMLFDTLPDETVIYPGHDYGVTQTATMASERRNNKNAVEYGFYM